MKRKDKLKKNIGSRPSEEVEKQEASSIRSERFPVVGIGASAGGLAAFEAFFRAMSAELTPGMAFVLVQHLAPDHTSILSELIRRYTQMQVFEIEDGMVLQQNCVYITPDAVSAAAKDPSTVIEVLSPIRPSAYTANLRTIVPLSTAYFASTSSTPVRSSTNSFRSGRGALVKESVCWRIIEICFIDAPTGRIRHEQT